MINLLQFSSVAQSCPTLWDPMNHSTPGLPVHHQLPEFPQTHVHWVGVAIQRSHLLSSPSPPNLNLSQHQGVSQWVFALGGQSVTTSASASILPMNIQDWSPFRWTGWISLQSKGRTLKSLLQHHSSKPSIFQRSAFFIVQPSSMTTGKTIVLTRWMFVGKAMSLLFNMLSRFVIAFLPRSKCLLISWLKSPSMWRGRVHGGAGREEGLKIEITELRV